MRLWSNNSVARGNGGFNPEKRLLSAVLQRAITDFLTGEGELQLSAKEWIFCTDDTTETFGFSYICEALDLHADELRKVMTRQYEQTHSKQVDSSALNDVKKQNPAHIPVSSSMGFGSAVAA
jgi:hypothetical protein